MEMDSKLPTRPTGARGAGRALATPWSSADATPLGSRSVLVDVDGLRCEVRSMRSVPHALYSTPSVCHVIATHVRQLIDDFARSLLLCRPAKRVSSSSVTQAKSGDPHQQQSSTAPTCSGADLTAGDALAAEDEETYLLLRLCVLEEAAQLQQPSKANGGGPPAATGQRVAGANPKAVVEQLTALFAAAERERRRHGLGRGASREGSERCAAAALMPPLLSSLLRFKPMLRDMRYLAQHLLLPRHAWQHHQREWVIVYEDVAVTLRDRLTRCRRAARRDGSGDRDAAHSPRASVAAMTDGQRLFSVAELQHLWYTLWELLGAAWRQRDRLWGAYRYLQGPRRLPPLCLSSQAPYAVPPGVHACSIMREQYECHIARACVSTSSPSSRDVPPAPAAAHAEDTCAFGPFTSVDIGVSSQRLYVLRQPLAAVLRTLRVSVPPAGRDPLATTTAFAGVQYVDDPLHRGQKATPAPTTDAAPPLVVPLFDVTDQDAQLAAAAVPYVSPEVYLSLRRKQQQRRDASCSASPLQPSPMVLWPPVHAFSDDVWNAAVVVLEAALSGFCATDASVCHLALSSVRSSGADLLDQPTAISSVWASSCVYSDVLLLLTERHALPMAAAHNFLYAAVYHLQMILNKGGGGSREDVRDYRDGDADASKSPLQGISSPETTAAPTLPSPARLAREWLRYLRSAYGPACLSDGGVLAEVASKGLCWRRSERWNAFGADHIAATTASVTAACVDGSPAPAPPQPAHPRDRHQDSQALSAPVRADSSVDNEGAPPSLLAAATTPSVHEQLAAGRLMPRCLSSVSQPDSAGFTEVTGASAPRSPLSASPTALSVASSAASPAGGGSGTVASSWVPQQLDRALNALDTPLLRLLSLGQCRAALERGADRVDSSPAGSKPDKAAAAAVNRPACGVADGTEEVSAVLANYLRRYTVTGDAAGASAAASTGACAGRANGAVAEAADVDCVDELLRLLFCCLMRTMQCYRADGGAAAEATVEECRYAAINHPFFRGVAERGLLTAYMAVACCSGSGDRRAAGGAHDHVAAAAGTLPALNLYVPAAVLRATVREMEAAWKASGVDGCMGPLVKKANSLRTLIGDIMRSWEASAAASGRAHQQQQQLLLMNPFVGTPVTLLPPPVHRARRALDNVFSPIDFNLEAQLQYAQQLRRLLYGGGDGFAGGDGRHGGKAAHQSIQNTATVPAGAAGVRAYLKALLMPDTARDTDIVATHVAYSPFYPLPPTLRGEVWGCLLHVPPSARTREALLAHAVHHTAAKPTPHDRQLSVDIPRCHAYHPLLSSSSGSAQLQRILRAWLYLHPGYAYWQGLDSVCAVLLTVSNRDEALVLAQLNAIVDRFIAHDEDGEKPRASEGGSSLGSSRAGVAAAAMRPAKKPTMAEQLHRLVVVLRYCDPLLAHYLFDVLSCTPELYAISWLLTLFSHSLPARKVYALWDLLFVEDNIACLVLLCAVVIIHRREVLLSADFSGCLAAFSSGSSAMNVAATVGDTRWLMTAVPPSVLAQPPVSPGHRTGARESLCGCGRNSGDNSSSVAAVAFLSVEDVAAALAASATATATANGDGGGGEEGRVGHEWFYSGVYLVDMREPPAGNAAREAVLGAISLPLRSAARPSSHVSAVSTTAAAAAGSTGTTLQRRELSDARAGPSLNEVDEADGDAAGDGWGIVELQERLQVQQQAEKDAMARQVEDAAAAIVRHVGNPAMAAILPRVEKTAENSVAPPLPPPQTPLLSSPWPVHPIVQKVSRAPHVVLLTSGIEDAHELPLAHQLGVKLSACGVHNVSILRGGVASMQRALPELVVRCAPPT
ncbi:hypothetical protein JIQ42_08466 [Leishmania sp. Namibia]|uniref:hypothetical protein n=1 Tax=Leishmania sp. Namibia TaxID=2802991 RepID=UPI001B7B9A23|nr:hypothetical protein JIQ42_08466 [Leishmania sp. Namibia]